MIGKWLKAGIVLNEVWFSVDTVSPQVGVLSALFCNICMHGLEEEIGVKFTSQGYTSQAGPVIIRFADDFIILCSSEQVANDIRGRLNDILFKRGMKISEAKTSVKHILEGFDFLGFEFNILAKEGY